MFTTFTPANAVVKVSHEDNEARLTIGNIDFIMSPDDYAEVVDRIGDRRAGLGWVVPGTVFVAKTKVAESFAISAAGRYGATFEVNGVPLVTFNRASFVMADEEKAIAAITEKRTFGSDVLGDVYGADTAREHWNLMFSPHGTRVRVDAYLTAYDEREKDQKMFLSINNIALAFCLLSGDIEGVNTFDITAARTLKDGTYLPYTYEDTEVYFELDGDHVAVYCGELFLGRYEKDGMKNTLLETLRNCA